MLTALFILVGLFAFRVLIFYFSTYLNYSDDDIKLSYKNFMSFVNIASDKYQIWNDRDCGPCVLYSTFSHYYRIYFKSYISWVRVKYYFYKRDHDKSLKNKAKVASEYINFVKRDLEKYIGEHNL